MQLPIDMLVITAMSAALATATLAIRKAILKREDLEKMAEIQAYQRELLAARRKNDHKAIQKLEKRKEYIQKLNAEVSKKNLMVIFASLILFFTFYPLASGFFLTQDGQPKTIGYMPSGLNIPFLAPEGKLDFYGWFILSFFAVNSPLAKLLGVSFSPQEVAKNAEKNAKDKKQEKKER